MSPLLGGDHHCPGYSAAGMLGIHAAGKAPSTMRSAALPDLAAIKHWTGNKAQLSAFLSKMWRKARKLNLLST